MILHTVLSMLTFRIFFIVLLFSFVFSSTLLVVSCCFGNMFFSAMSDLPDCVSAFFPTFAAVFSVPAGGAAAGKRRHSYQSGVPGLAKDMDRLRVSAAAANAGGNQGSGQGRSPRGSTRRRASSARRSSRSGNQIFVILVHSGLILCEMNLLRFRIFVWKSQKFTIF